MISVKGLTSHDIIASCAQRMREDHRMSVGSLKRDVRNHLQSGSNMMVAPKLSQVSKISFGNPIEKNTLLEVSGLMVKLAIKILLFLPQIIASKINQYFSSKLPEIITDDDMALKALKKNPHLFERLSEDLKHDANFVLTALRQNAEIYSYIPIELRLNRDFSWPALFIINGN